MPRIRLNDSVHGRHKRRKEHYGLTWDEYLDAGCPQLPDE